MYEGTKGNSQLFFFLFNDMLIATKKNVKKKQYKYTYHIRLSTESVYESTAEPAGNGRYILRIFPKPGAKEYCYQTESKESRDNWLQSLTYTTTLHITNGSEMTQFTDRSEG